MQTKLSPIDSILPYPQNPRTHSETQIDRIAKSIKEFGFNQPIVIDEKNVVLVGHGRLEAAKKLGLGEIPTVQLKKLTEAQKTAYRVLDNKLQNDSTWDFESLELEFKELEANGFDLEPWGLDDLKNLFSDETSGSPEDEWLEMPEYSSKLEKSEAHTLIVRFLTKKDLEDFSKLIDQKITTATKSIWIPEQHRRDLKEVKVIQDTSTTL